MLIRIDGPFCTHMWDFGAQRAPLRCMCTTEHIILNSIICRMKNWRIQMAHFKYSRKKVTIPLPIDTKTPKLLVFSRWIAYRILNDDLKWERKNTDLVDNNKLKFKNRRHILLCFAWWEWGWRIDTRYITIKVDDHHCENAYQDGIECGLHEVGVVSLRPF